MDLGSRLLRWVRRVAPRAVVPVALLATLALVGFGVLFLARPSADSPQAAVTPSPEATRTPEAPFLSSIGNAPEGRLSIVLGPRGSNGVESGEELIVDIGIVNRTDQAMDPGELSLLLLQETIDTRFTLSAWFGGAENQAFEKTSELGRLASPRVPPGEAKTISMTLPAGSLFPEESEGAGPRGLIAELRVGGETVAHGRGTAVTSDGDIPVTPLAVIVPVVAPLSTEPVLDEAALASLTNPNGQLTRVLDAVQGTQAVLAIDPRILLSIRALGNAAPASASRWLDRLSSLPNDSFALPYGDADLALEAQAGLTSPLELESLTFALGQEGLPGPSDPGGMPTDTSSTTPETADPAGTAPEETPGGTGTPTQTASPSRPAGTDAPGAKPGYAELTAFSHDFPEVLLPAPGTVPEDRLGLLASWGYSNLLLDSKDVAWDGDPAFTPDARASVSGQPSMVADHELNEAMSQAAGNTGLDHQAAVSAVETILATVSRELPNDQRTQLAIIDREVVQGDPVGLSATLRTVQALGWTASTSLSFDDSQEEFPEATLRSGTHDEAAVTGTRELIATEQHASLFASAFDNPALRRGSDRASLLQAVSTGWNAKPEEWAAARQRLMNRLLDVQNHIAIVPSSEIHVVGHETQIPVFVQNETDERVTVRVDVRPTTGHIEAAAPVPLTIEAQSMARAIVPIQVVTNGRANAQVTITTPDGHAFASRQTVTMNVSAQLETVLAASGASLLGVGVVWGVARTIRKRRESRMTGGGGSPMDPGI